MHHATALKGDMMRLSVSPWVMASSFLPVFWVVNSRWLHFGTMCKLIHGNGGSIEDTKGGLKGNIHQSKGVVVVMAVDVFTRPQQEKEPNDKQVQNHCQKSIIGTIHNCFHCMK